MIDLARIQSVLPAPVQARHSEYSMIFSADDDLGRPTERLIALAIDAAEHARKLSLSHLSSRLNQPPYYPDVWPGEHYKLLAGLVRTLNPKKIIEIGTGSGLSALALQAFADPECQILTFDTTPWQKDPSTCLRQQDFESGQLKQYSDNLADPLLFSVYVNELRSADFFFIDAAKDGITEDQLLKNLSTLRFNSPPIFVFDDIKLWNMLRVWRDITKPKLDVTSFGHWSGTGLVEWI